MRKFTLFLVLTALLFSTGSYAQIDRLLEDKQLRSGYISFAKVKREPTALTLALSADFLKELTGSTSGISFAKTIMELPIKTAPRVRQEKYQLFKNGIRLRGAEYLVTFVNDTADFMHGFFASVSNDAFSSEFNEQASSVLSVKYFNELHKISNEADSAAGVVGEVAPIYYFDYAKEQFQPTYQVLVASKNRRYVENIFVSAVDGELLGTESLLCEVNFPGTAQSQYSGAINIVTDASTAAGPFRLQETRGPNNLLIRTRNMNNRTDYSLITDFTDNDNNW